MGETGPAELDEAMLYYQTGRKVWNAKVSIIVF